MDSLITNLVGLGLPGLIGALTIWAMRHAREVQIETLEFLVTDRKTWQTRALEADALADAWRSRALTAEAELLALRRGESDPKE